MERTKWTDDLLEQRFVTMDEKSDQLFAESRATREEVSKLRQEMCEGFSALRTEMHEGFAALRAEMHAGFAALRAEMGADRAQVVALHRQWNAMMGTALVAVLGLLGVLVAKL